MNNYLVQYKNYMLPTGRQFSIGGAVISFTKEKMTVDVYSEIERQLHMSTDNPKFKAKVNEVYSALIADYKCEPYMSIENAKNAILDIRNDEILNSLKLKAEKEVERLRLELLNKTTELRLNMEKDAGEMESKLQAELSESIGQVNKEEANIIQSDKELKSGDLPLAEQIRLKEEIAQSQQRSEANKLKMTRQLAGINAKVEAFKKSKEKDMRALEVEYNKMINDLKKKSEKDILDKAIFLTDRKKEEIALIDKILNFEELSNAKELEVTAKEAKDIVVEISKEETTTEKAKANEKKPTKK